MPIQSLRGVRIVAFTQFLLGPAGVQLLADLGADVVKVESPAHGAWERHWSGAETFPGGVSALFLMANRNQRSVTLNLKSPRALEAAKKLVGAAEIVIENLRPGVMDRLGLGYEAVRQLRRDIVYVSASGYGADGPYRDLPGQDLLVQAMSGLAAITGRADEVPVPAGAAVVDAHGGALLAMATLAALLHRERTGEGQRVEVVMMEAALNLAIEPVVYHLNGTRLQRPDSWVSDTFHEAPYGIYPTADGAVAISMSRMPDIRRALGIGDELAAYDDPAIAFQRRDEISRSLAQYLLRLTTAEIVDRMRGAGLWCAPVNGFDEVFADPAVRALNPVLEFDHPDAGRVRALKHPVRYGAGEPELRRIPPQLGEHTDEVLAECGYSTPEIQAMRDAGDI